MVCVDGYILTHTLEGVSLPSQEEVDRFLPPYAFARTLDSQRPLTMGTMVAPDHFSEIRHAHDLALRQALETIPEMDAAYAAITGRTSGGLLEVDGPDDASIGVLCLGAVHGTLWEAREQARDLPPAKLIKLRTFRPFPDTALRQALAGLSDVVVLERAFSPGAGGIVAAELCRTFYGTAHAPRIHSAVMGLGGRDIPLEAWQQLLALAQAPQREGTVILDLIPEHLEEGVA
jgi:pyruvate ferredoxin oxidoreductase alpha subunit